MPKVLVLGSEGMLGHMVFAVLRTQPGWMVEGTTFRDPGHPWYFDAQTGEAGLAALTSQNGPFEYFINCIGLTQSHIRENDPRSVDLALALNAAFPKALADFARARCARVIHMSTDGVFSPQTGTVDENQVPDATDVYGRTKAMGEIKNNPAVLNLRTSIVGPSPKERGGLLEWFLHQPDQAECRGFTNQLWRGVTTLQFAHLCRIIIRENRFEALREESAVFHWTPNRALNKYELLLLFQDIFRKTARLTPAAAEVRVTRLLETRCSGLARLFPANTPMRDALVELKNYMQSPTYQIIARER